ncbi:hypothetical protein DFR87_01350 [Metallosphaera hakonensis JCM 8857 = DSM 7519]|nr:hypothetical protein [Metallosphaera hakonensis]AWR98568.2 hypothetical protein DFR87_01350 [Metallosphaera hakonensis JCM 8857 = DSM 7519]
MVAQSIKKEYSKFLKHQVGMDKGEFYMVNAEAATNEVAIETVEDLKVQGKEAKKLYDKTYDANKVYGSRPLPREERPSNKHIQK